MSASPSPLAPHIQAFFTDHLCRHKRASPQTLASCRDSFRLLLTFVKETTGIEPSALGVADLDAHRPSSPFSTTGSSNEATPSDPATSACPPCAHFSALWPYVIPRVLRLSRGSWRSPSSVKIRSSLGI